MFNKLRNYITAAIIPVLFLVGCQDSSESWIQGKWDAEVFGIEMEMDFRPNGDLYIKPLGGDVMGVDFRPNGDLYIKPLGGDVMGEKIKIKANPKKAGKWSFDGEVLTVVSSNGTSTEKHVITQTEEGFKMQPPEPKLPITLKRASKQ